MPCLWRFPSIRFVTKMEFEGAELDSSTLRGLVRTMSGSLDRLTERGGGSTDELRKRSVSEEVIGF